MQQIHMYMTIIFINSFDPNYVQSQRNFVWLLSNYWAKMFGSLPKMQTKKNWNLQFTFLTTKKKLLKVELSKLNHKNGSNT